MAFRLVNLVDVTNNIRHDHIVNTDNTYLHGMTVDGNEFDLKNNYNVGFQQIAPASLMNLVDVVNNIRHDHIVNTDNTYLHGMTVDGNEFDLKNNYNVGFQQIAPATLLL